MLHMSYFFQVSVSVCTIEIISTLASDMRFEYWIGYNATTSSRFGVLLHLRRPH